MEKLRPSISGFTLIEILVAIVIVSILTSVVIVSTGEARDRAKVVAAYGTIQEFELALRTYKIANELRAWPPNVPPHNTGYIGDGIEELTTCSGSGCNFPGFSEYMPTVPEDLSDLSGYSYFNQGNNVSCSGTNAHRSGVSIRIGSWPCGGCVPPNDELLDKLYEHMDDQIENDDDPDCGVVRRGGSSNSIYYLIGDN